MDIFKASIVLLRRLPEATSVHDRYFLRAEDAVQTFKNILAGEADVSISSVTEDVYDKRIAIKNGVKIAELRILKLPLYDTARASLNF